MKDPKNQSKQEKTAKGLLGKIEAIDKKLNLFSILGKSLPAFIISSGALLVSILYMSSVAYVNETPAELPQTGSADEILATESFIILYPEESSEISLPSEIVGLSLDGFYTMNEEVSFIAREAGKTTRIVGIGEKGEGVGEYKANWENMSPGTYTIWAQIDSPDGTKLKSEEISVEVVQR